MYQEDDEPLDSKKRRHPDGDKKVKTRKTRKILLPSMDANLDEVSELLTNPTESLGSVDFEKLQKQIMKEIKNYWMSKRLARNGLPLLRRLKFNEK